MSILIIDYFHRLAIENLISLVSSARNDTVESRRKHGVSEAVRLEIRCAGSMDGFGFTGLKAEHDHSHGQLTRVILRPC